MFRGKNPHLPCSALYRSGDFLAPNTLFWDGEVILASTSSRDSRELSDSRDPFIRRAPFLMTPFYVHSDGQNRAMVIAESLARLSPQFESLTPTLVFVDSTFVVAMLTMMTRMMLLSIAMTVMTMAMATRAMVTTTEVVVVSRLNSAMALNNTFALMRNEEENGGH